MIFLSRVQLILKLLIRMCRVFLNVLSLILKKPLIFLIKDNTKELMLNRNAMIILQDLILSSKL